MLDVYGVSILVMLDDALVRILLYLLISNICSVSILVMLDDALVLILTILSDGTDNLRLNPCYAGRCSSTVYNRAKCIRPNSVSILVMLDDALVLWQVLTIKWIANRLNPCYAGRCSSTY